MYAILVDGNVRLRTNEALREYARLEYPGTDADWILAAATQRRKTVPRGRRFLLFGRHASAPPHPVACKGSPRIQESVSPA